MWISETNMYFLYASTAIAFKVDIGAVTTCMKLEKNA